MKFITIFSKPVAVAVLIIMLLASGSDQVHSEDVKGNQSSKDAKSISRGEGAVVGDYQLSIHLEKEEVNSAEPVVLQITIKNTTNEKVSFIVRDVERIVDLMLKTQQGETIPLTRYGKRLFEPVPGPVLGFHGVDLKAGEAKKYRLLINRIYDMSVPETYLITAKRVFSKGQSGGAVEVVSNTARVNIRGFDASEPPNPASSEGAANER